MYFTKIRHPANFAFADRHRDGRLSAGNATLDARIRDLGEDVFHVELTHARWAIDCRTVRMFEDFTGASRHRLAFAADGSLALTAADGSTVLAGLAGMTIGHCGQAWLVQFARNAAMRFYGQGEKTTGLEKTGKRTKFWNTDVWGDFPLDQVFNGTPDPLYVAIPYLLIKQGDRFLGILVDNPGTVFMDTGSSWCFTGSDEHSPGPTLWFGADDGIPAFYVIAGGSAAAVTERLQRLVGKTPLPPLWSLGHHQCRWGYAGTKDLVRLDAQFRKHRFPCDGLWLDIDYMDGFRVFTTDQQHFPGGLKDLAKLEAKGRHVVPIIDPGVKVDPGYEVCESGLAAKVFCENPTGAPYVGFVWPGRTYFPDYSLTEARRWWADYARQFRSWGFHGAWLDMNDPSVGAAELDDMRFQHGTWPHWTYHNQYGLGMAMATREGFLAAKPDERPFLLARSASAGSSRYTAVWTGDNYANWHHLRNSIPTTVNLALSGLPFNGPDAPGFGGSPTRALAIAWYKTTFLFPFLRNHSIKDFNLKTTGGEPREPWAFGASALTVIRHYVRLRYKLLPYLYQLWIAQEQRGAAIIRPLWYDFASTTKLDLDRIADQFLIGGDLLQAPIVEADTQRRDLVLPGTGEWFDAAAGKFLPAGKRITVRSDERSTPLYVREGAIIPMQLGEREDNANDLAELELHVFLRKGSRSTATLDYAADDGISFGHHRGERSRCSITAKRSGTVLHLRIEAVATGWKPLRLRVVGYDGASSVEWLAGDTPASQRLKPHRWTFAGKPLRCAMSGVITLG